jgi:mannose-6-phosphate isomerase-like protein (cupin superfamily)
MRAIHIAVCGILTLGLSGSVALGQAGRGAAPTTLGGIALRLPAPTNRAVDWQAASLNAAFKEMVGQKLETSRILEGGVFNFNVRRETAAEEGAGSHGKKSDLYLIRAGEATLTTDGELISPKKADGAAGGEGDIDGTGIRNGKSRLVKPGDVIFIPAGVPHQITAVNGEIQFLLFRWDTK